MLGSVNFLTLNKQRASEPLTHVRCEPAPARRAKPIEQQAQECALETRDPPFGQETLKNFVGRRGLAAVLGLVSAFGGSVPAAAQGVASTAASGSIPSMSFDLARKAVQAPAPVGAQAQAAVMSALHSVAITFGQKPFAAEAAWLYRGGWGLQALVDKFAADAQLDEEINCLATAVYFEARGETVEGQLAVARVVMNRAASGKYPPTWCGTVKQPWQFSFVRNGRFPAVDRASASWGRAVAIAKLAANNIVPSLSNDVLWYHADYVAPAWGPRLVRVEKIGAHIFYRA